jgi:hypothetical protein
MQESPWTTAIAIMADIVSDILATYFGVKFTGF